MDVKMKEMDTECVPTHSVEQGTIVGTDVHMKRRFSIWNIIALGFNISNSWVAIAASLAIAIATGGTVTLLYGILVIAFVMTCTALSLAELGSVYPTAGGQYHFTWYVAPKKLRRGLSYISGVTSIFAWVSLCASINIVTAQIIVAIVLRYDGTYILKPWHTFLVYQALNFAITFHNVMTLRKTLWTYNVGAVVSISLCIIATVVCPARSATKANTHQVWSNFINSSNGWPNGVSFLTGISTPQFMFLGLDSVLHLAEECLEPERVLPKALLSTVGVGSTTAFAFAIAMVYSVPDMTGALATATGLPIYAVWEQATRSHVAATIFVAVLLMLSLLALTATIQTASRLTWAFARDDAIWKSSSLASVHPKLDVPIWSLVLNSGLIFLIGIVYLCSTTAFNAFVGSAAITSQVAIAIPMALLLFQKRQGDFLPPSRRFKLPKFLGYLVNTVTTFWALILLVFLCLPVTFPVTTSNMNYCSVVLGIAALIATGNWYLYAKAHYQGPRLDLGHR